MRTHPASNSPRDAWQLMVLPMAVLLSGHKAAQIVVNSVVHELHLGADVQNLAVVHHHAVVIYHVLVYRRPAGP
ncbi:hypothetical protein EDB85DRAFT_578944 [Lactarius pseudohatsudake]|nr:hypothetical protein EDB85DRAFT_578944 [Lactarius pseudohatsudake]